MKNKTLRLTVICQLVVLLLFLSMTLINELVDIPHYLLGDAPTLFQQRLGELYIELFVFAIILIMEILIIIYFYNRIKILEGFIPICANCKKIRAQNKWEQIESYIAKHSLAQFTHSICPDCNLKIYPELYDSKDVDSRDQTAKFHITRKNKE